MSVPNRPSFQKATKSTSSSSSSSAPGGVPGGKWNGNYSAGVSPVRGLSPVRGTFHGVGRPDIELARSHNNPLFNSRTSDIGRLNSTPTKPCKDFKENRDKQEQWKVPAEKAQYSGKTLCSTPGKSSRTTSTMRFTTPPKPVVKRKILAENRDFTTGPPRMKEEIKQVAAATPPKKEVITESVSAFQNRNEDVQCQAGDGGLSSLSPERRSSEDDTSKPKSPLVSIEELQKRIQKFLQDEGTSADVSVPISPRQSTESLRRLSGITCEESSLTGGEEASFQPVMAPYSPRPEYLRARKSPTPFAMEGNVSPLRGEDSLIQEKTTPTSTYDPKNNFLSPRPQFLRYKPLRRLELLRKSAEGTLCDLDLESPATDAGSSRMGSEKDEKEENDTQDVSQEVQSPKSSLESPPRCKLSSHDLFKSVETSGEIAELNTEEQDQSISSSNPLETEAGLEVPSSTPLEYRDFKQDDQEEQLEDDDMNTSASVWYSACRIATILALVALLVVASGSPSLLPTSLHHNHLSHLWKTSKATEPIRQFLQTTEGLWAVNPHLADFPLPSPDILRVSCVQISSLIQSVDLSKVVETGKFLWSSGMEYSARFGRLVKSSYIHFKASLDDEMDFRTSQSQDVNEWDWVPDYDFVVPRDMFDPVEAYESIMARVESWEVKSLWSAFIQAYSKKQRGSKGAIRLIVEQPTDQNLDSSIKSGNSSQCSLSSRPEDEVVLSIRLPASLDRVFVDIPVSRSQVIELNVNILETNDQKDVVSPQELSVGGVSQGNFLSVHEEQEQEVSSVVAELSTPDVVSMAAESPVDKTEKVECLPPPTEGDSPLSDGVDGVAVLAHDAKEIRVASAVEDLNLPEPTSSEDPPFSVLESSQEESSPAEAFPVLSSPEENDINSQTPLETKPETPRSLTLERLMHAPSSRTTAAYVFSLLLAAGVALLVFQQSNVRSGKGRRGNPKKSAHRPSKSSLMEPQFIEANKFQAVQESRENDFFVEDSSAAEQLASDHVKQFATPYPVTVGTPDRFLGTIIGKDLTPQKSLTQLIDRDAFESPVMGIVEESSLGRYSTMVPVVHNEGTAKERVQLTPVRRSRRIRTRMQSSPCNLMHSPHLCNC